MRGFLSVGQSLALGLFFAAILFACAASTRKSSPHESPQHPDLIKPANSDLPFPDVIDSSGWDLSVHENDSVPGVTAPAQTTKSLLPGPRLEGVRLRPRPKDLPEKIHVLLLRGNKSISIYSLGEMEIISENASDAKSPAHAPALTKILKMRGRFVIRRSGAGFDIEQGNKKLESTSARRLRLISVNPYNLIDLGGTVYRGGLHVLASSEGNLQVVNVLGVEDYLRGVLPYELGKVDREGLEALKALAIVARTYAYKRMQQPGNSDFHVFSDVQDQVYKGVKGEYLLSDRAVWETRSMAVLFGDSLAQCFYSSTCGGSTSSKHEVWGGDSIPYLVSRSDMDESGEAYCQSSKYSTWNEEWTPVQLSGILKRNLHSAGVSDFSNFSSLLGLDVITRATCGRVRILKITTDKGQILVKGDKVRWALRPVGQEAKILSSAWVNLKMGDGKISAVGHGFGHGVGLCQVGAIGRAHAGQTCKQIIEAYFKGVQVVEFK